MDPVIPEPERILFGSSSTAGVSCSQYSFYFRVRLLVFISCKRTNVQEKMQRNFHDPSISATRPELISKYVEPLTDPLWDRGLLHFYKSLQVYRQGEKRGGHGQAIAFWLHFCCCCCCCRCCCCCVFRYATCLYHAKSSFACVF